MKKRAPKAAPKKAARQAARQEKRTVRQEKKAANTTTKKGLFVKRGGVSVGSKSKILNKREKGLFGAKNNSIKGRQLTAGVTKGIALTANTKARDARFEAMEAKLKNMPAPDESAQYREPEETETIETKDSFVPNPPDFGNLDKTPKSTLNKEPLNTLKNPANEVPMDEDVENETFEDAQPEPKTEPKKDNKMLMIGIGLVVLAVIGFFMFKKK